MNHHIKELARQLPFKDIEEIYLEKLKEIKAEPMDDETKMINEFAKNMLNRKRKSKNR